MLKFSGYSRFSWDLYSEKVCPQDTHFSFLVGVVTHKPLSVLPGASLDQATLSVRRSCETTTSKLTKGLPDDMSRSSGKVKFARSTRSFKRLGDLFPKKKKLTPRRLTFPQARRPHMFFFPCRNNRTEKNTRTTPWRRGRTDTQRGVLPGISRERHLRSKTWWFTELCNSHYVSHFAAFFIGARTKISIAKSCSAFRIDLFFCCCQQRKRFFV